MDKILKLITENPKWGFLLNVITANGLDDDSLKDLTDKDLTDICPVMGEKVQLRKLKQALEKMDPKDDVPVINNNQIHVINVDNEVLLHEEITMPHPQAPIVQVVEENSKHEDSLEPSENNIETENDTNDSTNNGGNDQDCNARKKLVLPKMTSIASRDFVRNLDLAKLLDSTLEGRLLHNYYDNYSYLENEKQLKVVRIIIQHLILHGVKFECEIYLIILQKIAELFPKEDLNDYGFVSEEGEFTGKLINMKRNEMYRVNHNDGKGSEENGEPGDKRKADAATATNATKLSEHYRWLKHNTGPYEELLKRWDLSYEERKTDLLNKNVTSHEYLEKWYHIKNENGESLLEMDFSKMYPGKDNVFYEGWEKLVGKLEHLKKKVTSAIFIQLLASIDDSTSEDERDYKILRSLPAAINGTYMIRPKKGKLWRPSLLERSDAIIQHVKLPADVETAISTRVEKMAELGLTCQPFIIAQGPDLSILNAVYVYLNGKTFKFESVQRATEMAFKIFMSTNASYPKEAEYSWLFLQRYVFEINTEYDKKGSFIPNFIKYLNSELR